MSIKDLLEKVKPFYNLLLILIIACIFFFLGRLSALEERHTPIKIESFDNIQTASVVQTGSINTDLSNQESGLIIGSKSGKKYYFPWCGTVKMIKPENQVKFASIEEAKAAGYTAALNCKGLK